MTPAPVPVQVAGDSPACAMILILAPGTMLHIHNSMSGRKEPFVSIQPGQVRMYVCGVTVYDDCHLGHARVWVVFDMIARFLRSLGYQVRHVRNITDIDDKIIRRAAEQGQSVEQIAERFIQATHDDERALRVQAVDAEPRATEYIEQIIAMIRALFARGYAYQGTNRDVYFRVARFAGYGRLSGKDLQSLRAGARVAVDENKENPLDFVLWKTAGSGEPSWDSPWGPGRPGWHIECSAMASACLGERLDIHGGGQDLLFPHHENERAQSEGASGQRFVNFWMHNGFVQVAEEKMSKSLGNTITVRGILQHWPAEAVRFFILSSHYRSPLYYSHASLDMADRSLRSLYTALRDHEATDGVTGEAGEDYQERFQAAMEDDFNTPRALAVLHDMAHALNCGGARSSGHLAARLRLLAGQLGLLQDAPEAYLQGRPDAVDGIEALIAQRTQARESGDFASADAIRDKLHNMGVAVEDQPQGTRWRRV